MRSLQTGHPLNTSSLLPGAVFVQLNFWPFRNSDLILVLSFQSVHGFQDVRDPSAFIHLFIKSLLGPSWCQGHGRRWNHSLCDHYRGPAPSCLQLRGSLMPFVLLGEGRGVLGAQLLCRLLCGPFSLSSGRVNEASYWVAKVSISPTSPPHALPHLLNRIRKLCACDRCFCA